MTPASEAAAPSIRHRYGGLVAWSAALTLLLGAALAGLVARGDAAYLSGVVRLRNVLGYGHFTLAYIFTWSLIRRRLGDRGALRYLAAFAAVIALYAAAQRWWVPAEINELFVMVLFMVHHVSNEALFQEQSRNGYRPFAWTPRRVAWVALGTGLILIDRFAVVSHHWHGTLPWLAASWGLGWLAYGGRYLLRAPAPLRARLGWAAVGALVAYGALHGTTQPLAAVRHRFAWIVIYHYVVWYVFYTRKLRFRTGGWQAPAAASRSLPALWTAATTAPAGFLALVAAGNLLVVTILIAVNPLTRWATAATGLDFFSVNTVAHILFGVGVPARAAASAAGPSRAREAALPQFA